MSLIRQYFNYKSTVIIGDRMNMHGLFQNGMKIKNTIIRNFTSGKLSTLLTQLWFDMSEQVRPIFTCKRKTLLKLLSFYKNSQGHRYNLLSILQDKNTVLTIFSQPIIHSFIMQT